MTALPFTPINSALYRTFHTAQLFPSVQGGFQSLWSPLLLTLAHNSCDKVKAISISPDGTRIASGSWPHGNIHVWDLTTGVELLPAFRGHDSGVTAISFSPDGRQIVSGSQDWTVRVWDSASGIEQVPAFRGDQKAINSIACALSPDHDEIRVVSSSDDRAVRIWCPESQTVAPLVFRKHGSEVNAVAFAPDGRRIVSGSKDKAIRIWDSSSGVQLVRTIRALQVGTDFYDPSSYKAGVNSLAFLHDGNRVVSGSRDKTIRIWDSRVSGLELCPAFNAHERGVTAVSFAPDGALVVSGSDDRTVRVWDSVSGVQVFQPFKDVMTQSLPLLSLIMGDISSLDLMMVPSVSGKLWRASLISVYSQSHRAHIRVMT